MPTIQIIGVGPFDMFRSSKRRQPEQVQVCPGLRYKDHQAKAEGLCVALLSLTKPWEHDGWAARQGVFKSMSVPCLWLEVLDRLWPAHSQRWCRLITGKIRKAKERRVMKRQWPRRSNAGIKLRAFHVLGKHWGQAKPGDTKLIAKRQAAHLEALSSPFLLGDPTYLTCYFTPEILLPSEVRIRE